MIELSSLLAVCLVACADGGPLEVAGIDRIQRIDDSLLVGSQPGAEAFEQLREAGVTVILSVDGRFPDVQGARAAGLRTVHLPLGYDGIEPERLCSFKRLVAEEKGPIYVHCHRGIHRGPAAAAILWMLRGHGSPEQAREILERSGASPRYRKLWEAVEEFVPPTGDCTDALLPERVQPEGVAAVMLEIDRGWENLKRAGPEHPDIEPQHELLMLEEYLRELDRLDPGAMKATRRSWAPQLRSTQDAVKALQSGITVERLRRLQSACNACHAAHRE